MMAVYNRWTGTVDWTSGLDYWILNQKHAEGLPKHSERLSNSAQGWDACSSVDQFQLNSFACVDPLPIQLFDVLLGILEHRTEL